MEHEWVDWLGTDDIGEKVRILLIKDLQEALERRDMELAKSLEEAIMSLPSEGSLQ
jgi:hypothetical protein